MMSIFDETKKVLDECDEFINMAIAEAGIDIDSIASMGETDAKAAVMMCKLYKQTKDLALNQARIIDRLERQNDELLGKVDVLLARTKPI